MSWKADRNRVIRQLKEGDVLNNILSPAQGVFEPGEIDTILLAPGIPEDQSHVSFLIDASQDRWLTICYKPKYVVMPDEMVKIMTRGNQTGAPRLEVTKIIGKK